MTKCKNIFLKKDDVGSESSRASAAIVDTPIASRTRSSGNSVATSAASLKSVRNKGGDCRHMPTRNDVFVTKDDEGSKSSPASAAPADTPIASRTRSGNSISSALSKISSTCRSSSSSDSIDTAELIATARKNGGKNPGRASKRNVGDPNDINTCSKTSSTERKSPARNKNNENRSKRNDSFTPVQKALIVEEMTGSDESACEGICTKHGISFKLLSKWKDLYREDELLLSKDDLRRKRMRDWKRKKYGWTKRKNSARDPEYISKEKRFSFDDKSTIVKEALRANTLSELGKLCEKHDIPYQMLLDWKRKYHDDELHLTVDEIRSKKIRDTNLRQSLKSTLGMQDAQSHNSRGESMPPASVETLTSRTRKRRKSASLSLTNEYVDMASEVSSLSSFGSYSSQSESSSEENYPERIGHHRQPKKKPRRKHTSDEAAEQGITPRLHKAYLLAKKNREWLLTNNLKDESSECIGRSSGLEEVERLQRKPTKKETFPLEMQRQYAKERKAHIKDLKRAASNRMTERRKKDAKLINRENSSSIGQSKNICPHPGKISINIAERVMDNIKQRGLDSIGDNTQECVTTEIKSVLRSMITSSSNDPSKDEDVRKHDRIGDLNRSQGDYFFNPIDWDCSNRYTDDRLAIYENMPIPNIDHLVGWATSHRPHRGNDRTDTGNISELQRLDLQHIHAPPPPPSQVRFLLRRLGRRMMQSVGGKHSNGGSLLCNEIAKKMSPSAGVAFGIAVEDIFTVALMPLAKKHVNRCRYLEKLKNSCESNIDGKQDSGVGKSGCIDPFDAWTMSPQEAIAEFAMKPTFYHDA
ncbi:hypothetical protein ACHAXS_004138 [Conticribra weissflogii]